MLLPLELVETLVSEPLPPTDWKAIAQACLPGADYLLWRSEFQDRCFDQADSSRATQIPFAADQLAGEGQWGSVQQRPDSLRNTMGT
jgi:hypothetical protein